MRFYDGKKIFITGGSSGIGKAAAVMLAKAGASVMVAARNQDRLDATVDEMQAVLEFGCFSSCNTINKQEINLIFTLESGCAALSLCKTRITTEITFSVGAASM